MKQILYLILLFFNLNLFGQKPTEKVGEIEIELIGHNYIRNSDDELTENITNKKNRPYLKMYFDSDGLLLKTISFGKLHNTDLKLINQINIYNYDSNGFKSKIDIWETDYKQNLSHKYYKKYYLDSTNTYIFSEELYSKETDSIYTETKYWYNENDQYLGIFLGPTHFRSREYNDKNQVVILEEVLDSQLRWDWHYTYYDNKRIGIFQTYYKDGNDYSKKEISTYDELGRRIEIEELQITKDGLDEKTKIYYGNNGIINKIKYYESYSQEDGYNLISFREIKVKSKAIIDAKTAKKINQQIFPE